MKISEEDQDDLMHVLKEFYGYDFSEYSRSSLKRRIDWFIYNNKFDSYEGFKEYLLKEKSVFLSFIGDLTVNVTELFRDPSFFLVLREKIMPILSAYPNYKVWHAGCSTGEEVYSTAILLEEINLYDKALLFATDINYQVLSKAKEGTFSLAFAEHYGKNYREAGGISSLSDYYTIMDQSAVFHSALKRKIIFATHNLVHDGSFNEFNLIVCRNVLIYFNNSLQNKVIRLFYDSLCMFGYLALGPKESLHFSELKDRFEVVDQKEKIFRKIK